MNETELPSLPDDVALLLEAERTIPPAPQGLSGEVWQSLSASLAALPPPGAGPASSVGPTGTVAAGGLSGKALVAVVSFALGGATVAVVDRVVAPAELPMPAPVAAPVRAEAPPLEPAPVVIAPAPQEVPLPPAPAARPRVSPPPATTVVVTPVPVAPADQLADERAVLEVARTALARGRPAEAVDALKRHAERFPTGQLAEERDFLWVQCQASAGELAAARERARAFRAAYPRSMMLPALDEVLSPPQ
jgi:hypothetical protein